VIRAISRALRVHRDESAARGGRKIFIRKNNARENAGDSRVVVWRAALSSRRKRSAPGEVEEARVAPAQHT
jgi:hypothetical protein